MRGAAERGPQGASSALRRAKAFLSDGWPGGMQRKPCRAGGLPAPLTVKLYCLGCSRDGTRIRAAPPPIAAMITLSSVLSKQALFFIRTIRKLARG